MRGDSRLIRDSEEAEAVILVDLAFELRGLVVNKPSKACDMHFTAKFIAHETIPISKQIAYCLPVNLALPPTICAISIKASCKRAVPPTASQSQWS